MKQRRLFEDSAFDQLDDAVKKHFENIFRFAIGADVDSEDVIDSLAIVQEFIDSLHDGVMIAIE